MHDFNLNGFKWPQVKFKATMYNKSRVFQAFDHEFSLSLVYDASIKSYTSLI